VTAGLTSAEATTLSTRPMRDLTVFLTPNKFLFHRQNVRRNIYNVPHDICLGPFSEKPRELFLKRHHSLNYFCVEPEVRDHIGSSFLKHDAQYSDVISLLRHLGIILKKSSLIPFRDSLLRRSSDHSITGPVPAFLKRSLPLLLVIWRHVKVAYFGPVFKRFSLNSSTSLLVIDTTDL
jgi:hypothetical protein